MRSRMSDSEMPFFAHEIHIFKGEISVFTGENPYAYH